MDDLIEALTIAKKYALTDYQRSYPTNCSHDELMLNVGEMSGDDAARMEELGFNWNQEFGTWVSYKFGSC